MPHALHDGPHEQVGREGEKDVPDQLCITKFFWCLNIEYKQIRL